MAASSSSSPQPDHHRTGAKGRLCDKKHRRASLGNLNIQVPATPSNASCFTGCFRPSPTSASPAGQHGGSADRPASPSLIRSPSAWIRAKGQSFSSGKHTRRRSRDFKYDALSYARNFEEGGTDGEDEEEAGLATSDALKYRLFSSRLPTSPPQASPSPLPSVLGHGGVVAGSGGNGGKGKEPARETGRVLD
ncbi:hypothetical protein ACP70R_019067 [Stipagrostis hirtigluma subsp. patula]